MTAQSPERIILNGRPHCMYAEPLFRLGKHYRLNLHSPECWSTGNYRGYIGTWEIGDGRLYLVHLNWDGCVASEVPVSNELRQKLFRAARCKSFPIHAHWFNGRIRVSIGRRLVYSHHGWSHWFERERVIHFRDGEIVRDREVDTRGILEWWLRRHPEVGDRLDSSNPDPLGPLTWFDDDDEDDWEADWWPPDYARTDP